MKIQKRYPWKEHYRISESSFETVGTIGSGASTECDGTNDMERIQGVIDSVSSKGGGVVLLLAGEYNATSIARTDTGVSFSDGVWSDASITSSDVGRYVLGENIDNERIPKITSVVPGVSFETDVDPKGTVSSQSIVIVKPGLVLPAGVTLKGLGSSFADADFSSTTATTKIVDSGSGITILTRGGGDAATMEIRYGLDNISIQGDSGSTMYGLLVGTFGWFFTARDCDFSHHGLFGVALDGDINSDVFENCTFRANGKSDAVVKTGGVITHPFYLRPSSSLVFQNCFFEGNYGWGICDGKATGTAGACLNNCQFNSTLATSAASSGVSAAITDHANNADAKTYIIGGWSESAARYDLDIFGYPTIINFTMASAAATNHCRIQSGTPQLIGCRFQNLSGASVAIGSGGNLSWMGCTLNDSYFYSGCGFSNATIPQIGTTEGSLQLGAGTAIRMGSGAPGAGLGSVGDVYFRTDGGVGTTFYLKTASDTWTGRA